MKGSYEKEWRVALCPPVARSTETVLQRVGEEDDKEQNSVYVTVRHHLSKNRVKIKIWYLASSYKDTPESCIIKY